MIWDVFPFFNELELLDIRLNVHGPYVDRFVLVEGDTTHSGLPKPWHYWDNRHLFEKFNNRIAHVGLRKGQAECPTWHGQYFGQASNPFINEGIQRNYGLKAMQSYADGDIIHYSDLDEITRLDQVLKGPIQGIEILEHRMYYCYLNVWCGYWGEAKLLTGATFRGLGGLFHNVRHAQSRTQGIAYPPFKEAGWHFSFMGGPDRIRQKLAAYAEASDYNKPHITNDEQLVARMNGLQDILCRNSDMWFKKVPITEETHPKYVVENLHKFKSLIMP